MSSKSWLYCLLHISRSIAGTVRDFFYALVPISRADVESVGLYMAHNFNKNIKASRKRRRCTIEASNALYVLWSRSDDPERRHLVDEDTDELRRVLVEKELLLRVCRELWNPKW